MENKKEDGKCLVCDGARDGHIHADMSGEKIVYLEDTNLPIEESIKRFLKK